MNDYNSESKLRSVFENELIQSSDREHAFIGYWWDYMEARQLLTRDDLIRILERKEWVYGVSEVISLAVKHGRIDQKDMAWLMSSIRDNGMGECYGFMQLDAAIVLNDPALSAIEKLEFAAKVRADWIVKAVVEDIPSRDFDAAEQIIKSYVRGRHSRHLLLTRVRQRRLAERVHDKN